MKKPQEKHNSLTGIRFGHKDFKDILNAQEKLDLDRSKIIRINFIIGKSITMPNTQNITRKQFAKNLSKFFSSSEEIGIEIPLNIQSSIMEAVYGKK